MAACLLHDDEWGCLMPRAGGHAGGYPCTPRVPEARLTRAPRAGVTFADRINPVPEVTINLRSGGSFLIIDLVRGTIPLATEGALSLPPRRAKGGGPRAA